MKCLDRTDIYYWKCDRGAAFHGTDGVSSVEAADVQVALESRYPGAVADLAAAAGQGNHRTYRARLAGRDAFIRVGAGYFRKNDGFFLIGAGQGGGDLAAVTRAKLELALVGLEKGLDLDAIA